MLEFWYNVTFTPTCWIWNGSYDGRGYGRYRIGAKYYRSHRIAYEFVYGTIGTNKLYVCHKCDVRGCVRPGHLFLGTPKDNVRDCMAKNRFKPGHLSGSEHPRTHLTDADILSIRLEYALGNITQTELAKLYGVAQTTISAIIRNINWKGIT